MVETEEILTAQAFQEAFLRLRPQLLSFLFRMTTSREDAEDLAQDTYLKATRNLTSFSGRSSLKTWLFAIAANLARDRFRARRRWREDSQERCRSSIEASPEKMARLHEILDASPVEKYELKEHVDYCFTCLSKTLEIEQQLALILKEVYAFKVAEIMEILHLSEGKVKHALANARRTMTDIFDRRCALVNKQGVCHECSEMQGFVNPKQDARVERLKLKMVQAAERGASKEHLFALRAELVRQIDPLQAPGAALHDYFLACMPEDGD